MSANSRAREGGFTLIELLVALTILTIIVGIIYGAYGAVVDSIQDTRAVSEQIRTRQFIKRSLEQNVAQASEGWSPGAAYRTFNPGAGQEGSGDGLSRGIMRYPFLGGRQTTANGPADMLTFVSSAPMAGGTAIPGTMKLCTYHITQEDDPEAAAGDEPPRTLLTITEAPWIDPGVGREHIFTGAAQAAELVHREGERAGLSKVTVSVPVYAWELAYFDGKDWKETWDSQQIGRLPWAVRVRVKVHSPQGDPFAKSLQLDPEEDAGVIELTIPVPIGAGVFDAPPDYARPSDREST